MDIFVVILIIALVAAVAYIVMQRKRAAAPGLARPRGTPLARGSRARARRDPMAAAVAEHAQATDPQDALAAEQRLRAQARQVAAGLHAEAGSPQSAAAYGAAPSDAAYADPRGDERIDPTTGARTDGYGDPANDPRYGDSRYDGRLAADYVPPEERDR